MGKIESSKGDVELLENPPFSNSLLPINKFTAVTLPSVPSQHSLGGEVFCMERKKLLPLPQAEDGNFKNPPLEKGDKGGFFSPSPTKVGED